MLGLLCAVLLITTVILGIRLANALKKMRMLLDGARGENLERLLYDHLRERLALQEQVEVLGARTKDLETKIATTKRHLGLVRYDAFDDIGGAQSFALALYDDKGDGAVLTSLVGRADCRVYAKPITNGRSERTLSQEEQRAIQDARNGGPKTILTP